MIGEVLYLIIATVALIMRRLEHWISERFSGSTVTQIKPGELEARDAEYFKRLRSKSESERHEAERGRLSKHKSHGTDNETVKIRKSQTMKEILDKRKRKSDRESFQSEVWTKGTMKQIESASIDVAKQELPNPAIIEQETSKTAYKKSDKFVKFRNKKVQLTPPLTKTVDTTTDTKVSGKLPPLKEQMWTKGAAENGNVRHNFKPKHKRKLSDILRNLPRKMTPQKSFEGCNLENQTDDKETAVKKQNGVMQKNVDKPKYQKKKNAKGVFSKKNSLKENSSEKGSFAVVKPLNSILKRRSVPNQVSSLNNNHSQTAAETDLLDLSTSSTISAEHGTNKLSTVTGDEIAFQVSPITCIVKAGSN